MYLKQNLKRWPICSGPIQEILFPTLKKDKEREEEEQKARNFGFIPGTTLHSSYVNKSYDNDSRLTSWGSASNLRKSKIFCRKLAFLSRVYIEVKSFDFLFHQSICMYTTHSILHLLSKATIRKLPKV